jgi:hypothetical protein
MVGLVRNSSPSSRLRIWTKRSRARLTRLLMVPTAQPPTAAAWCFTTHSNLYPCSNGRLPGPAFARMNYVSWELTYDQCRFKFLNIEIYTVASNHM